MFVYTARVHAHYFSLDPQQASLKLIGSFAGPLPPPDMEASTYFEQGGRQSTALYRLENLRRGHAVPGPAILIDSISTVVVEPGCTAHITSDRNIKIDVGKSRTTAPAVACLITYVPPSLSPMQGRNVGSETRLQLLIVLLHGIRRDLTRILSFEA